MKENKLKSLKVAKTKDENLQMVVLMVVMKVLMKVVMIDDFMMSYV